jgi:hypothetical protein
MWEYIITQHKVDFINIIINYGSFIIISYSSFID